MDICDVFTYYTIYHYLSIHILLIIAFYFPAVLPHQLLLRCQKQIQPPRLVRELHNDLFRCNLQDDAFPEFEMRHNASHVKLFTKLPVNFLAPRIVCLRTRRCRFQRFEIDCLFLCPFSKKVLTESRLSIRSKPGPTDSSHVSHRHKKAVVLPHELLFPLRPNRRLAGTCSGRMPSITSIR